MKVLSAKCKIWKRKQSIWSFVYRKFFYGQVPSGYFRRTNSSADSLYSDEPYHVINLNQLESDKILWWTTRYNVEQTHGNMESVY